MSKLQDLTEGFRLQYEKFLHGCDSIEMDGDWNVYDSGDMETYYFNDMLCLILHLVSADGEFTSAEADFVNAMFGSEYTAEELAEVYQSEKKDIRNMAEAEIPSDYRRLKTINEGLADLFKEMLFSICEIISESDGILRNTELNIIDRLHSQLD